MTIPENKIDMITASNHIVNYGDPTLTVVDPEDLRIHTKNICRYNGALDWKLVQHLDLCGELASEYMRPMRFNKAHEPVRKIQSALAVSHDFHEIYCTDVVSGMKKYLDAYRVIENDFETYVHEQLGLPVTLRNVDFIRKVDVRALVIEMTLLGHPAADLIQSKYGGEVEPREKECFKRVEAHSLDKNWSNVWRVFNIGREYYKRHGEPRDIDLI